MKGHLKIWVLGEGEGRRLPKTNISGELPKKGGLGQFADLSGGARQRRREWCFLGGLPNVIIFLLTSQETFRTIIM